MSRSEVRRLAGRLRDDGRLRLRQGLVDTVNSDGTVDVTLGGDDVVIDGVALLGRASDGVGVWVLQQAGDLLALGSAGGPPGLRQVVTFTTSGTFDKADYPWLRAVRVRVQAGGGGSGGIEATGAGQGAGSGGGGGGGYCEGILAATELAASEPVAVGLGGALGAAGLNDGGPGGDSSFGSHMTASGGLGGSRGTALAAPRRGNAGGAGGAASGGAINVPGGQGENGWRLEGATSGAAGGASVLGKSVGTAATGSGTAGATGQLYGGGAAGAANTAGQGARGGRAGADGIVIVELYG